MFGSKVGQIKSEGWQMGRYCVAVEFLWCGNAIYRATQSFLLHNFLQQIGGCFIPLYSLEGPLTPLLRKMDRTLLITKAF